MKYRAEINTREHLGEALTVEKFEYVYAPMELLGAETPEKPRIIAVPPIFLGGDEPVIAEKLQELREDGFRKAQAHTLGHIGLIKSAGLLPCGGFRLNITNSLALKKYEELGLTDGIFSVELSASGINAMRERKIPVGIMVYGYLPLMVLRRCPVRDSKHCGGSGCNALTDRLGNRLQTLCRLGETEVLNPVPLVLGDKIHKINADFCVFRFTAGENVMEAPAAPRFTRGMYFKGVK